MTPQLSTPVQVPPLPLRLDLDCGIVALGSCFADEIGSRLLLGGFNVELNPFGTLYNPASIATALERIIDCRELTGTDLVQHEGLWHSWLHHGSFSRPTTTETLDTCNSRMLKAHEALRSARLLMITFGTAWVYETGGNIVGNCHKLPATMFTRRRMTVEEIVAMWSPLLTKITAFNPKISIMFTVSPIRHMADGAHGNQLSKATLLLAVDELCSAHRAGSATYFPSYEIVLDELRDYRFFGPDMAHPTPLAIDVVYDRFQQATMSAATMQQAHNNAKQRKREAHIPLH